MNTETSLEYLRFAIAHLEHSEPEVFEEATRALDSVRQMLATVSGVIEQGAELMTLDQLRQWEGHGAILHFVSFEITD